MSNCNTPWSLSSNAELNIFITTKPKFFDDKGLPILDKVFQLDELARKVTFYFDTSFQSDAGLVKHLQAHERQNVAFISDYTSATLDFGLVFGGDGSVVWANKYLKAYPRDLPLFTFNLGSVGFISKFRCDEVDDVLGAIRALANDEQPQRPFYVECYPKLSTTLVDASGAELASFTSINEIIIEKPSAYSNWMDVSVDDIELLTLNADGLLFASQMGSTAYNASVNGPFLFPGSSSFIMSAIAPFAINFKSIVLPGESRVCVRISHDNYGEEVKINSDSNDCMLMTKGQRACISVSERKLCIVHRDEDLKRSWASKIAKLYRWSHN